MRPLLAMANLQDDEFVKYIVSKNKMRVDRIDLRDWADCLPKKGEDDECLKISAQQP
jgi:hypothetical protein